MDFFNNSGIPWQASQIPVAVTIGGWSAEVTGVSALNPFVWQVDVAVLWRNRRRQGCSAGRLH